MGLSGLAFGAGSDVGICKFNIGGTACVVQAVPTANDTVHSVLGVEPNNHNPTRYLLGSGFSVVSSQLRFTETKPDWNAAGGTAAEILNRPTLAMIATTGYWTDLIGVPDWADVAYSGEYADLLNAPVLADVATSGDYADLLNVPTEFAPSAHEHDTADLTSGTIADARLADTGTAGTYSGITTDAKGRVTAGTTRSFSYPARSLNTSFQPSTTRDAMVSYSVDVSTSATLLGGQTGTVFLEIADDTGFTTNVQEVARFVNGNSVSLAIAITITQNVTGTLSGVVPAGKFARLRTANTAGTPTFNFRSAQEILM